MACADVATANAKVTAATAMNPFIASLPFLLCS
jgi:hypothetical protein